MCEFVERERNTQRDGRTDRQSERGRERRTDRQSVRERERERDTERWTVKLQNLQTEQHTECEFLERERERERYSSSPHYDPRHHREPRLTERCHRPNSKHIGGD